MINALVTKKSPSKPKTAFQRISSTQAVGLIHDALSSEKALAIFDVRNAQSYREGHIKGADHLTEQDFYLVINSLPKHTPVMIYCYHGHASQVYASMFADFKYNEVYSVDGGYEALAHTI